MFSVLIRYKETRREVLIQAKTVEFIPPGTDSVNGGIDQPGLHLSHGIDGECGHHLGMTSADDPNWRDVFVMNAQGRTVARYVL